MKNAHVDVLVCWYYLDQSPLGRNGHMDTYESQSNGVKASGYLTGNNKFMIEKGSFAVGDSDIRQSLKDRPRRIGIRNSLISEGKMKEFGEKYLFTENIEFNSPSEAASIIWGSMLNGKKVFGISGASVSTHESKHYFEIESKKAIEGYEIDKELNASSRDKEIVNKRKELDNYTCQVCGYKKAINQKFVIECHHLTPISLGVRETTINDLVSLCPTCHRIVHLREPIYSLDELKVLI